MKLIYQSQTHSVKVFICQMYSTAQSFWEIKAFINIIYILLIYEIWYIIRYSIYIHIFWGRLVSSLSEFTFIFLYRNPFVLYWFYTARVITDTMHSHAREKYIHVKASLQRGGNPSIVVISATLRTVRCLPPNIIHAHCEHILGPSETTAQGLNTRSLPLPLMLCVRVKAVRWTFPRVNKRGCHGPWNHSSAWLDLNTGYWYWILDYTAAHAPTNPPVSRHDLAPTWDQVLQYIWYHSIRFTYPHGGNWDGRPSKTITHPHGDMYSTFHSKIGSIHSWVHNANKWWSKHTDIIIYIYIYASGWSCVRWASTSTLEQTVRLLEALIEIGRAGRCTSIHSFLWLSAALFEKP